MMRIDKEDLEIMYLKARKAFDKCIKNSENEFLKDELEIPIDSIYLEEELVSIEFSKNDIESYTIKTRINLFSQGSASIGTYTYYENEKGVPVDDSLVFN